MLLDILPEICTQRQLFAGNQHFAAALKQGIQGSLAVDNLLFTIRNQHTHQLTLRIEGDFCRPVQAGDQLDLGSTDQQRRLSRVTGDLPMAFFLMQRSIIAELSADKQLRHHRTADLSAGDIAGTTQGHFTVSRPGLADGHLVFGQGAGFIGADDITTAEGFD